MVQLAAELVRLKPDVLVVSITEAALAARSVTKTIPIVMANAADPVGADSYRALLTPAATSRACPGWPPNSSARTSRS